VNNTYIDLLKQQEYAAEANRPCYDDFDTYVAAHPEGEGFRRWLTEDGKMGLVLVPCYSNFCGLPGDYYFAYIAREYRRATEEERQKGEERRKQVPSGLFFVHVNDCDDSGGNKFHLTLEQAREELANLKLLAPFTISELEAFGYETA